MPQEADRLTVIEVQVSNLREDVARMRNHISDLLTFKNHIEGGMKIIQLFVGLGLVGQIAMLFKMFLVH